MNVFEKHSFQRLKAQQNVFRIDNCQKRSLDVFQTRNEYYNACKVSMVSVRRSSVLERRERKWQSLETAIRWANEKHIRFENLEKTVKTSIDSFGPCFDRRSKLKQADDRSFNDHLCYLPLSFS